MSEKGFKASRKSKDRPPPEDAGPVSLRGGRPDSTRVLTLTGGFAYKARLKFTDGLGKVPVFTHESSEEAVYVE